MLLRCECGTEFEVNWSDIYAGKKYCNYCAKSKRFDGLVDYNDLVAKECEKRGFILLPNQDIKRNSTRFQYICKKQHHKNDNDTNHLNQMSQIYHHPIEA